VGVVDFEAYFIVFLLLTYCSNMAVFHNMSMFCNYRSRWCRI